jgi:hypothetical protein
MMSKNWLTRTKGDPPTSVPPNISLSLSKDESNFTFVRVVKPSRFIDIEPVEGSLRIGSLFPQYFMKAIFAKAWAVAVVMG